MDEQKRRKNEKQYGSWLDLPAGGRLYWYAVQGRHGWTARYVKEVDENETTVGFSQEIFNDRGDLVEVHHKYPVDTGHVKIEQGLKQ